MAAALSFVFTSMYQRVTRLSEYRFWGGSGNMANFNVPHIFNESNVFNSFKRKAETIAGHLATTATGYEGDHVIRTGSASNLSFLPDRSVDLVFTDPPFGANINYSEMNFLWEAWLGEFTDPEDEVIINRFQEKDLASYRQLMQRSLEEAHRVLRDDHWMVLVFMNSSEKVWAALREAIENAGFRVEGVDIFDKQHGTFKQFVSKNTAGADLMLHCRKVTRSQRKPNSPGKEVANVTTFVQGERARLPMVPFIHVKRASEVDYRTLYSRYIASAVAEGQGIESFTRFRAAAAEALREKTQVSGEKP